MLDCLPLAGLLMYKELDALLGISSNRTDRRGFSTMDSFSLILKYRLLSHSSVRSTNDEQIQVMMETTVNFGLAVLRDHDSRLCAVESSFRR
jgi:hypothetical protein